MQNLLNVASYQTGVTSLGPGKRFVVWLQGCPFDCKNCMSQSWIPFEVANLIDIKQLAKKIIEQSDIEGITLSGGEPMMQASILTKLLSEIKAARPDLNIICFTGFRFTQLQWPESQQLLKYIDVIICGLYVDALNNNKGLRGSINQEVIFLSDKLKQHEESFLSGAREIEVTVANTDAFITGMPAQGINLKEI